MPLKQPGRATSVNEQASDNQANGKELADWAKGEPLVESGQVPPQEPPASQAQETQSEPAVQEPEVITPAEPEEDVRPPTYKPAEALQTTDRGPSNARRPSRASSGTPAKRTVRQFAVPEEYVNAWSAMSAGLTNAQGAARSEAVEKIIESFPTKPERLYPKLIKLGVVFGAQEGDDDWTPTKPLQVRLSSEAIERMTVMKTEARLAGDSRKLGHLHIIRAALAQLRLDDPHFDELVKKAERAKG